MESKSKSIKEEFKKWSLACYRSIYFNWDFDESIHSSNTFRFKIYLKKETYIQLKEI